ncbi:P-loop containing nucleoside triphosphate hydrolase protein [Mycena haematopus]|nr:P-loop containing nucleoside triphosphate hydrolase protein [Mycena haematopus]
MQGIEAQLQMRGCVVHAGTGMGKTTIAAGPHAHPSSVGKVTLMISPLIALHDEQVATFRDEFKLKAIAINSSHGGCKLEEIVRGEHQIVLISPEMALSRRFIREVLRTTEFGKRVMSVVVDEAHVVSHWGASFRKKYGTLGMIRAFLPRGTPVVALSATLPARIRNDVLSKLQFGQDYVNIDVGNDRPNVSIIVRGIQHPLNTYADLKFVAAGIRCRADIKKTFIYADNIATGVEILDYLISLLPPELHDAVQGWDIPIRPYNAALSQEYRRKAMEQFRAGIIRILVCTDAAGMGCNIPDINVVVQWKLPASLSLFVQRAGRAARASGRTGLAILLVEPSAYGIDIEKGLVAKGSTARGKKTPAKEKESDAEKRRKAKQRKLHAKLRGVNRGASGGKFDTVFVNDTPPLDPEAADEGLLVFTQTGECRRKVLTTVYNNKTPNPTVPCCDICCPELLDLTRPGEPPAVALRGRKARGQTPDWCVERSEKISGKSARLERQLTAA